MTSPVSGRLSRKAFPQQGPGRNGDVARITRNGNVFLFKYYFAIGRFAWSRWRAVRIA
jgi:hypothetical protein